jgi:hypothetical protein
MKNRKPRTQIADLAPRALDAKELRTLSAGCGATRSVCMQTVDYVDNCCSVDCSEK